MVVPSSGRVSPARGIISAKQLRDWMYGVRNLYESVNCGKASLNEDRNGNKVVSLIIKALEFEKV
jgi:hypothetical protein